MKKARNAGEFMKVTAAVQALRVQLHDNQDTTDVHSSRHVLIQASTQHRHVTDYQP